jgi:FKBP-type peptidyl-prolyl cis-trans isomerase FkpA
MNFKLPLIAAFVALTALTACGGGDDPAPAVPVESPATLTKTDVVPGTGAEAVAPKVVYVYYSLWLYSSTAPGNKGKQFEVKTSGDPFSFKLGTNSVIAGFESGILGMKVGGKRTVLIPAAQAYGSASFNGIPANSGLVYDIELKDVR